MRHARPHIAVPTTHRGLISYNRRIIAVIRAYHESLPGRVCSPALCERANTNP